MMPRVLNISLLEMSINITSHVILLRFENKLQLFIPVDLEGIFLPFLLSFIV